MPFTLFCHHWPWNRHEEKRLNEVWYGDIHVKEHNGNNDKVIDGCAIVLSLLFPRQTAGPRNSVALQGGILLRVLYSWLLSPSLF
jgi:hypothetical protein